MQYTLEPVAESKDYLFQIIPENTQDKIILSEINNREIVPQGLTFKSGEIVNLKYVLKREAKV